MSSYYLTPPSPMQPSPEPEGSWADPEGTVRAWSELAPILGVS